MTKFDPKPALLAAVVVAGLAAAASTASAQNAPTGDITSQRAGTAAAMPDAAASTPRDHADQDGARMQRRVERMQVRAAQRLAALKVRLQLTPAQQGAWDAFEHALQPTPAQLQRLLSLRSQMRTLPTPQRIDRLRELRAERDAAMDRRFDATKTFYAQLSPEQQKTFDENALRGQGRHHRGGHHGGEHRGHDGWHGDHAHDDGRHGG